MFCLTEVGSMLGDSEGWVNFLLDGQEMQADESCINFFYKK